jgi:CBS domain-containing protein
VAIKTGARAAHAELSLSALLKRPVLNGDGEGSGFLLDVIVRLRDEKYPTLTGLVVNIAGRAHRVPVQDLTGLDPAPIRLRAEAQAPDPFVRGEGEVLLRQDVLCHRLIDTARSSLVKAYDIRLTPTDGGWMATGLDVHKHSWFSFGAHEHHPARDWLGFVLLLGAHSQSKAQSLPRWLGRLRPAQIADMIEAASIQERGALLAEVHSDPVLEASVFEELDEDKQAELLRGRSDQEVADVLSRMRADDVADAVMELPQGRRLKVLELLPQPQKSKVLTLLGYNPATAGGLMGTDFLALPEDSTVGDALQAVREAVTHQPEALTTIHSLQADGVLAGTLSLVRAIQRDPAMLLRHAAEPNAIYASSDDDIVAVTTRMADFNLLSLPVLDGSGRIIGIITVDDALEAAIPRDWARRETAQGAAKPAMLQRRQA